MTCVETHHDENRQSKGLPGNNMANSRETLFTGDEPLCYEIPK